MFGKLQNLMKFFVTRSRKKSVQWLLPAWKRHSEAVIGFDSSSLRETRLL